MPARRTSAVVAAWLAIVLASAWILRGSAVDHDLTQFMPTGATPHQRLAVELLREGPASRLILIGLRGGSAAELARLSGEFAQGLRASGLFSQVGNGAFDMGGDNALLFRYRYLLDPTPAHEQFTAPALRRALTERLRDLGSPLALFDRNTLASDPTAAMHAVLRAWRPPQQPRVSEGVWFSADGRTALLSAMTRASGFDPQAQAAAVTALQRAFAAARPAAQAVLETSGAPVFANTARAAIRADMQLLSTAGSVLLAALLLLVYRSPRLVVLSALPLATALLVGGAATAMLFGSLHGIALVFGMTLLGVAIDYPLHLFSHLHGSAGAAQTMQRLWPTLRLGVITTCIGYVAFARRDFAGLAQLGVFTASGLLAAALVTRWLLPPLIGATSAAADRRTRLPRLPALPPGPARLLVAGALLATAGLFLMQPPAWETDLNALSPIPDAARQVDRRLRGELGAADVSHLIVVGAANADRALERSEHIARRLQDAVAAGLLTGFDLAARYLPSPAAQRQRQQHLPDAATVQRALAVALQGLPFKAHGLDPFLRDLAASRQLPPLTVASVQGTPIAARIEPLLYRNADGWKAIITLSGVTDARAFRVWWEQAAERDAQYLDLKETSASLLSGFRESALERLLFGILALWLVLSLGLRSALQASRVLLPILVAVALSAALLGALGERLSLFHLIALLLTAGIGIDYSLFFHRPETSRTDLDRNHSAVLVCAVSTLVVFGILALSPLPVLRSIGLTVTLGVSLCFLLALAAARLNAPPAEAGQR